MISVIIPVYNAEKLIADCLIALLNQNIDFSKYEIIVVDDGSSDNTAKIVEIFKDVQLIIQKNRGPAAARNEGVRHAKGDIVVFTDSDCIPNKNWIEQMIMPFIELIKKSWLRDLFKLSMRINTTCFVKTNISILSILTQQPLKRKFLINLVVITLVFQ